MYLDVHCIPLSKFTLLLGHWLIAKSLASLDSASIFKEPVWHNSVTWEAPAVLSCLSLPRVDTQLF